MKKLLTIVVAAYNKEKLLPRCLDSLIVPKEQMDEVQILVVNDGSKDKTLDVAKEYEQKYRLMVGRGVGLNHSRMDYHRANVNIEGKKEDS